MESTTDTDPAAPTEEQAAEDLLDEELLVEEISIDGMCGVY
jgi:mycofactocin precursor